MTAPVPLLPAPEERLTRYGRLRDRVLHAPDWGRAIRWLAPLVITALAALLRLAVLLHRAHEADPIPQLDARADGNTLTVCVSRRWVDARPLVRADLEGEPDDIAGLGLALKLEFV